MQLPFHVTSASSVSSQMRLLADDPVGEGGEIGRDLVDVVVDARRRVHLSHGWLTRSSAEGSGSIGAIGYRLPENREVCGTVAEPYAGADRALGGEFEVLAEAEGRTTRSRARSRDASRDGRARRG
jgi:hypothetical protein